MAETETDAPEGADAPKKTSRAGRNLPAAIGVGAALGALAIGILLFAPRGWLVVLAVAIPIATAEVARRLGEAGYVIPIVPLLVGGQAMIVADVAATVPQVLWAVSAERSSCA